MFTQSPSLFDKLPLWLLFAATVVGALLSFEGGFRVGRWKSQAAEEEHEVVARMMVGAMLILLAFMLAFTFGMAMSRFDERRQATIDQANAIRMTYLRADLLPEPRRTEIRNLLREYVDVRLQIFQSEDFQPWMLRAEELHNHLWSQTIAAKEKASNQIAAGQFVQSLNEVIALHTKRFMLGERFRIPDAIWLVLYTVMALAVASIGYHTGLIRSSKSFVVPAFVIIFSSVMLLIVDLDRPRRWVHEVSIQAMVDLQKMMTARNR